LRMSLLTEDRADELDGLLVYDAGSKMTRLA
jgi:hypothetical protein